MITKENLQEAIAECQGTRNPTSSTCMKLAAYYTLMDHMFELPQSVEIPVPSYSYTPPRRVSYEGNSEFSTIIQNKDMDEVLAVIDELMDTLHAINPRLYEGVIAKLSH